MKIIVSVKRVIDYNVKVRVKSDNSDVDLSNVKMAGEEHASSQDVSFI